MKVRESKTCACGVSFERPRGIRNVQWQNQRYCSVACAGVARRTHGLTGSPEFNVWRAMLARCLNPDDLHWPHWGGRGITICDRWRESPAAFLEDMGPRPSPKHQIDRIDNDGNYEPVNCRWVLPTQNARNTTRNRLVTYHEKTLTLAEWCERLNLPYDTVKARLRSGWSAEAAFETVVRAKR